VTPPKRKKNPPESANLRARKWISQGNFIATFPCPEGDFYEPARPGDRRDTLAELSSILPTAAHRARWTLPCGACRAGRFRLEQVDPISPNHPGCGTACLLGWGRSPNGREENTWFEEAWPRLPVERR